MDEAIENRENARRERQRTDIPALGHEYAEEEDNEEGAGG